MNFLKPGTISMSLTRPSDTNAYAANDAMANATSSPASQPFSVIGAKGLAWILTGRAVSSANQSTLPQIRQYIFTAAPAMTNDNAAFVLTDAELRTCIAIVDFTTWKAGDDTSGAGGNIFSRGEITRPIPIVLADGGQMLYSKLKVLNAYTPVSAEVFDFYYDLELA